MILTLCTVCAAPLPEEAVRCSACATGYCSERCERSDRRRGGHGKICGAISSGGGAEQYHADKKYKEAVAEAMKEAVNYAVDLSILQRFEDAKSHLRKTMPVARRVFGENTIVTLSLRKIYAKALYRDPAATLDDLREAVTTLENAQRTARRVFGGEHPFTKGIEEALGHAQAALRAREDR